MKEYFFILHKSLSSPYINHFLQPDTIIPDYTNPQSWNRYAYVMNSPIGYNDPTGHCSSRGDDWCFKENGSGSSSGNGGSGNGGSGGNGGGCTLLSCPNPTSEGPTLKDITSSSGNVFANNRDWGVGIPLPSNVFGSNGGYDAISPRSLNSYCGGGSDGLYNLLDCGATATQDAAVVVDIPFAGAEFAFIALGCLGGPKGCAAGAGVGIELFNGMGGNLLEMWLSNISAALSVTADAKANGVTHIGEPSATAFAGALAGNLSPDPILDLFIDGYGSAYNHDLVKGIGSFNPFDSYPFIK